MGGLSPSAGNEERGAGSAISLNEFPEISVEYERRALECLTNAVFGLPSDRSLWLALAGECRDRAADARALRTFG